MSSSVVDEGEEKKEEVTLASWAKVGLSRLLRVPWEPRGAEQSGDMV